MAHHVSVSNQYKLSKNVALHNGGPALHTKQGIVLSNPKTKQVVIRRSYQNLNGTGPDIPIIPVTILSDN